jgi:hypothetical protein
MKTILCILLAAVALCVPQAHAATVLRIACGSSTGGTDAAGHVWQADTYFAGGTAYTSASLASLDLPYRTLRFSASAFSYAIPASDGDYILTLNMIENRTPASVPPVAAGQRKFSVSASGGSGVVQVVASNLDLYAVAGSLKPYTISIPVSVIGGKLFVTVAPDVGNALLSGIQLEPVAPPPPPPSVLYLTGPESAPPVCPASGLTMLYTTDTQRLLWCYAGSMWHFVGDVLNGAAPPLPALVKLERCVGTGPGISLTSDPPIPWNCEPMYHATVKRTDGSEMLIIGVEDTGNTLPQIPPVQWVEVK